MNPLLITLGVLLLLLVSLLLYLQLPKFGKKPKGRHLEKIRKSENYKKGRFQNKIEVPQFTESGNFFKAILQFLFAGKRIRPDKPIPSVKTDLMELGPDENVLVWFGHSSYFMKINGINILVDPVLSGNASAVPNQNKAFKGTDIYSCKDIPETDYLFLTHNHWDHFDYKTICELHEKIGRFVCPLGLGATLEYWGVDGKKIIETDWHQKINLLPEFTIHTVPAQHFSGRGFQRNKTLWTAYILETSARKIFLGGDSGYEAHFKAIGKEFGPFDLAILECGQYNKYWKCMHMFPEDTLQAGKDLSAGVILPVHCSKFVLSSHPWDEPFHKLTELRQEHHPKLLFPLIGQKLDLYNFPKKFTYWWKGIS